MDKIVVPAGENLTSSEIEIGRKVEFEGSMVFRNLAWIEVGRNAHLEAPVLKNAGDTLTITLEEGASANLPSLEGPKQVMVVHYSTLRNWDSAKLPRCYRLVQYCNGGNGALFERV